MLRSYYVDAYTTVATKISKQFIKINSIIWNKFRNYCNIAYSADLAAYSSNKAKLDKLFASLETRPFVAQN